MLSTRKLNGPAVRAFREAIGIRHAELARRAEINPGYLTRLETNGKQPSPEVLKRLANGLGVSIEVISYPVEKVAA